MTIAQLLPSCRLCSDVDAAVRTPTFLGFVEEAFDGRLPPQCIDRGSTSTCLDTLAAILRISMLFRLLWLVHCLDSAIRIAEVCVTGRLAACLYE